jgi:UDP-glucuronate decarboxylase
MIVEMTGSRSKLVHKPLPDDDPARRRPDITLAKTRLDWQPSVSLRDGLEKTIAWFRSIDLGHYRPPTPNYL